MHKSLFKVPFKSFSFTPFKLPDLPYDFSGLEPVVNAEIMRLHYTKHHQGYVNNYNTAVEQLLSAGGNLEKTVSLQGAIKFNGGGHLNHSIFWTNLAPIAKHGGELPGSESLLTKNIIATWGSYDNFTSEFNKKATAVQVHFYL